MKQYFIFCFYILSFFSLRAQIIFKNSSFEGIPSCSFNQPDYWVYCGYYVGILGEHSYCHQEIHPSHPVSDTCFSFLENKLNGNGDLSQNLSCSLQKDKTYKFEIYAASLWGPPDSDWSKYSIKGRLDIFLETDSCSKRQQIYHSEILDSAWHRLSVIFTPDSDGVWIGFWPVNDSLQVGVVDIALDALSPIYLINANAVHVAHRDTVVYTQSHEQVCVHLQAASDISTYDTVRWYRLNDTIKTPVAVGFSSTQCMDSSTTFLIGMRDSVIGCAGVEWSWDTVRVWVRDTLLGIDSRLEGNAVGFSISPNPVDDWLTISVAFEAPYDYAILDEVGRICIKGSARKDKTLDVSNLAPGAYLMRVERGVRRFVVR